MSRICVLLSCIKNQFTEIISISTHSCIWTPEDNSLPPTVFVITKQQRQKGGVRQLTLPVFSHRPSVCLYSYVSFLYQGWHTRAWGGQTCGWGARTSVTSSALSFFFLTFFFFHNTLSLCLSHPSLSCSHSLLSFSPNWPSCPLAPCSSPSCLPSPKEKPNNNTGHRSRERTGCVHNRPVAPAKTIIPFFFFGFSALLPKLEKTDLWRCSWRGGKSSWTTASKAPSPLCNCLKDQKDKHSCAHQL